MFKHKIIEGINEVTKKYKVILSENDLEKTRFVSLMNIHKGLVENSICFSMKALDLDLLNKKRKSFIKKENAFDGIPYPSTLLCIEPPHGESKTAILCTTPEDNKSGKDAVYIFHLFTEDNGFERNICIVPKTYVFKGNQSEKADGFLWVDDEEVPAFKHINDLLNSEQAEVLEEYLFTHFSFFLTMLNCKNVDTKNNPPPYKLNKKRMKRNKTPIFEYKTLVIKPISKKQITQEKQGLWSNAIHLCRGHFKEYTEEKPLFGKYAGRYFWQPMVRGDKKNGIVHKDYKLETT